MTARDPISGRFTAGGGGGGLNVGRLYASLDLDTSKFGRGLSMAGMAMSGFGGGLTRMFATLLGGAAAFSGVITSAAGLSSALATIAPAAAVAAPALLTLAQAGGTLALGFSGVKNALSAFSKQSSGAGASAGASASAQRAAANAIRNATESLADARERAADAYVESEKRNKAAVEDAADAQRDLNKARADALQRIVDLRREVERSGLSEREAALAVRDAERELQKVQSDGTSTADDQERATLAYERAKNALSDTREEIGQNKTALAQMTAQGVNGQDEVIAAQKRADEAQQNIIDTQVEGQKSIRDALKSVEKAQEQLTEAQLAANEKAAGGVNAYADALSKLPPKTQEFVKTLVALKPQFDRLKVAASDMMPGFTSAVKDLATNFPVIETGVRKTALALGDVAQQAGKAFSGPAFQKQLGDIMDSNAVATHNLGMAGISLGQAFFGVAHAARGAWESLTGSMQAGAARVKQWVDEKNATGELKVMIDTAVQAIKDLFATIGNILVIIKNIFQAAGVEGGSMLSVVREITGALKDWTSIPENMAPLKAMFDGFKTGVGGMFQSLFDGLKGALPMISQLLQAIGSAFAVIGPPIGELVAALVKALLPAVTALLPHVAHFAALLGTALANAIKHLPLEQFAKILGEILDAVAPLLSPLADLVGAVLTLAIPLANIIAMVAKSLAPILQKLIPIVTQIAGELGQYLADASQKLFEALEPVIPILVQVADQLGKALLEAIQQMMPSMLKMIDAWVGLLPAITPLIPVVADMITTILPIIPIFFQIYATLLSFVIPIIGELIKILVWVAKEVIENIVIPTVKFLVARFQDLANVFSSVVGWIKDKGGDLLGWFKDLPGALRDKLSGLEEMIKGPFKAGFNAVARLWNNSIGGIGFHAPSWVPGVGGKGWTFPNMPYLAKGGTAMTGGLAMVGERGPEILDLPRGASVIPLPRGGGGGDGSDQPLNITVIHNGPVYDQAGMSLLARQLAVPIRNELNRHAARNGGATGLVA